VQSQFMINLEKDLWEIYDIFRGEVPIEKIKHFLVSMKTLKYLSENNDHPFEIPFDCRWEQVTSHGIDIGKRFNEAFEEIEYRNPSLKGLWTIIDFSIINNKALFKVADSILNKYSFNRSLMQDTNPITGTMAQYIERLFEVINQKEGAAGGESSSPKDLAELLVQLLNINEGNIYDGFSGFNDFLIEAFKYSLKTEGSVRLFGQEINPHVWALGKMNLILHGLFSKDAEIKLGHTIIDPQWKTENTLKQFDGIISHPPFGIGNWGHKEAHYDLYGRFRYGIPSKSTGDMAFVLHFIASLKNTGRAVLIVPNGVLFRGASEGKIREELIKEDLIEAVIGLPSNLFYGTGIPVTVLIINKLKKEEFKKKIFIISAEDGFEKGRVKNTLRQADIEKITDTYLNLKEIDEYSKLVDISEIQQNEWNLAPLRYFDKVEIETEFGKVKVNKNKYEQLSLRSLGEIADINRGINVTKEMQDDNPNPSHFLINLSDVDKNGNIIFDDLKGLKLTTKKSKDYELQAGDVLISSRGTQLKVIVVPKTDIPLVYSSNFSRVRLYDTQKYNPFYIKVFLESPVGQFYVKTLQTGSTVTVLSTKDIAVIQIPDIPFDQQEEVSNQILNAERKYEETIKIARENKDKEYLNGYSLMGLDETFEMIK
jgi:type I restriction enzyme M protein